MSIDSFFMCFLVFFSSFFFFLLSFRFNVDLFLFLSLYLSSFSTCRMYLLLFRLVFSVVCFSIRSIDLLRTTCVTYTEKFEMRTHQFPWWPNSVTPTSYLLRYLTMKRYTVNIYNMSFMYCFLIKMIQLKSNLRTSSEGINLFRIADQEDSQI